jgi:hypothetical protein
VSNSEKSDEHFILLDVHQIEKRQVVAPSTTHMSDSAHLTSSSTTKMPSSNPPTSQEIKLESQDNEYMYRLRGLNRKYKPLSDHH